MTDQPAGDLEEFFGMAAGTYEGNIQRRLDARDAGDEDPWLALVMRSRLDPTVWIPVYGPDQSCYEHPGRLRAVKAHCEQAQRDGRFGGGRLVHEARLVWHRHDADTWWYLTADDAPGVPPSPEDRPAVSAARILDAIRAGHLEVARGLFEAAVDLDDEDSARVLVRQLADLVPVPPGTLLLGPSPLVWGNPFRPGWSWRCGPCEPCTWNQGTERGARRAARKHITGAHPAGLPIHEAAHL